ncbi:potassium-transporting ATPase subunit KdpA [Acuticoccus sp. M5D2P5]|uniref:potassium-transporting ATPase subunit KdpA n=1 Tax=Acuticoccus kalidii TaxID=2910977 RepID=UPI001F1DBEDE|nr:potassium-transporting ATPase subunit KdpA [Acuticoccus kalidii]MCF3933710.1 potassium-transporting ATPase subunit KdpA [Acuticoccus kalidii]
MVIDLAQFALYALLVTTTAIALGAWMDIVLARPRTDHPVFARVDGVLCRSAGIDPAAEQNWLQYAAAVLAFNLAGALVLYAILLTQAAHPFNPQHLPGLSPWLAFNTAISFMTNTNWQAYGGETTLSYFSQMAGLTVQNFVSAATGIAVGVAVIRGFARRETKTIGNFWVDLVRATVWILLPLAIVVGLALVALGVPQNLMPYTSAETLSGGVQTIAQGPAAAQIAIKQLGTNGGGFWNANSAHPFENPSALTNLIEMWAILALPAAFCFLYGRMVRDRRQGRAIFAAMAIVWAVGLGVTYAAETVGNPLIADVVAGAPANMEGKDARFGIASSALWAVSTTAASNGSVNAMHDSFTPIGSLMPLVNILTGEVIFGGVGAGFYGMLSYVVLAVFIAGLMVGRTPEYLGKKIETKEVKLALLAFFAMPVGILGGGALAAIVPQAVAAVQDPGPHGLTEILYAYASATGNNGSAFAGFGAGSPWHTTAQGLCMMLGRFAYIIPMLAIAGALAEKRTFAPSAGTFPTHGPIFVGLLVAVILVLGGLTFFPALALGPLAEQFAMAAGTTFAVH